MVTTQNFLTTKRFDVAFSRLPTVQFYVQGVNLPGVSTGTTVVASPFTNINRHGDKLTYEELTLTLRVDENLQSYTEVYNWLVGLTSPTNFAQYGKFDGDIPDLYSDASLFVLDSKGNISMEFKFVDVFPTRISGIQFQSTDTDAVFATCDVSFSYTTFDVIR